MTLAIFLAFIVEVGDTVCAKTDPRHEGKVQELRNGWTIVQFGWRGHLSLYRVDELTVVKKRNAP